MERLCEKRFQQMQLMDDNLRFFNMLPLSYDAKKKIIEQIKDKTFGVETDNKKKVLDELKNKFKK